MLEDMKAGQKEPQSKILIEAEEATIYAFGRHTLLPPEVCLCLFSPQSRT